MTTMGVTVYCNRVQLAGNEQEQLMLLRTLQDNESNIIAGQPHVIVPKSQTANGAVIGVNGVGGATTATAVVSVLPPYDSSRLKKHGKNGQPPPVAVARRNARERNRVKQVNNGFATLRQHIPSHIAAGYGDRGKKLSKVETLRMAVEYIRGLQRLLDEADGLLDYEGALNSVSSAHCSNIPSSPSSSVISSGHNGSSERLGGLEDDEDDMLDEQIERDIEEQLLDDRSTLSRLSPNSTSVIRGRTKVKVKCSRPTIILPRDHCVPSLGDEENLAPRNTPPNSIASPMSGSDYYVQNEENQEPSGHAAIASPYDGAVDNDENAVTVFAASPETFSTTLYYKQEMPEPGESMDVFSWWEQDQGRLVHHTQQHVQRLAHV